jgi:hypothetical protein
MTTTAPRQCGASGSRRTSDQEKAPHEAGQVGLVEGRDAKHVEPPDVVHDAGGASQPGARWVP